MRTIRVPLAIHAPAVGIHMVDRITEEGIDESEAVDSANEIADALWQSMPVAIYDALCTRMMKDLGLSWVRSTLEDIEQ